MAIVCDIVVIRRTVELPSSCPNCEKSLLSMEAVEEVSYDVSVTNGYIHNGAYHVDEFGRGLQEEHSIPVRYVCLACQQEIVKPGSVQTFDYNTHPAVTAGLPVIE